MTNESWLVLSLPLSLCLRGVECWAPCTTSQSELTCLDLGKPEHRTSGRNSLDKGHAKTVSCGGLCPAGPCLEYHLS